MTKQIPGRYENESLSSYIRRLTGILVGTSPQRIRSWAKDTTRIRGSRYKTAHQGARECARRIRQITTGFLNMKVHGA